MTAGGIGVGPATPVEPPAASAPGPGSSGESHAVFGQQLQDAHDSLRSQTDDSAPASAKGPKRAAARGPEKKNGDGDAKGSVPVSNAAPATAPLPFSLDFAITATPEGTNGDGKGKDESATGVSAQGEPDAAPEIAAATPRRQPALGDLAFALRLDPQATSGVRDTDARAGQPANTQAINGPVLSTEAINAEVLNGKPADNQASNGQVPDKQPGQNRGPVQLEASAPTSPSATPPVKDTRHSDQEDTPRPAPRTEIIAHPVPVPATEKNAPATSEPGTPQASADAAKALENSASVQPSSLDSSTKASTPLREMSIQVGQVSQDRVQLRLVEHAGELQVAVRSANPDLAQGLRQGIPDLVDRLQQNGFHAEAWRPGTTVSTVQGGGETRQRPMHFQQDQSQSQSGGQQGRQQNRQNQSQRPQWVQELEGNLSGGQSSGELNGLTS